LCKLTEAETFQLNMAKKKGDKKQSMDNNVSEKGGNERIATSLRAVFL
jgi:hypothetical protein